MEADAGASGRRKMALVANVHGTKSYYTRAVYVTFTMMFAAIMVHQPLNCTKDLLPTILEVDYTLITGDICINDEAIAIIRRWVGG